MSNQQKNPKIFIQVQKEYFEIPVLFSITRKRLIGSSRGFLYVIGLKEARISLTDTTHEVITVSEISYFN